MGLDREHSSMKGNARGIFITFITLCDLEGNYGNSGILTNLKALSYPRSIVFEGRCPDSLA